MVTKYHELNRPYVIKSYDREINYGYVRWKDYR